MNTNKNNPFITLRDEITNSLRSDLLAIRTDLEKAIEQLTKSKNIEDAIFGNAGDAAKRFGVSANTIRNWGRAGNIKKCMVGGVSLYSFEEIEKFIRSKGSPI